MEEDQRLAEAAQAMIEATAREHSPARVLQRRCPHIYRQLCRLRRCRSLFSLWGRSLNVDEYARQPIVHPAILQTIGQIVGVPMRGRILHAGLQHTYGYLFSLIDTPFGHKRDRWTHSTIEDGFAISVPTLRAEPVEGTLLTNLTWFAGRIALGDRSPAEARLRGLAADVSGVVRDYDYAGLQRCRMCEEVKIAPLAGGRRSIELRTDLVRFPRQPAEASADNHLLIYSIRNGRSQPACLITAFPVRQEIVNQLTAPENQGRTLLRDLPYNAYVRGLSGRPFEVQRQVQRGTGASRTE